MKKLLLIAVAVIVTIIMCSGNVYAQPTNKGLVKSYCDKHYATRTIQYTKNDNIAYKKSKTKVYVLIVKSLSWGKYGYTKEGYYIRYNKKVKIGKLVTSYLIYNPKTKYIDDVVAVVDCKMIR